MSDRPKLGYYWYLVEVPVVFVLAFFLAWVFFGEASRGASAPALDWIDPAATLIATFIGAMLAFLLEDWRDKRSQSRRDLASTQLAFLKLTRMLNKIVNIQRQCIDPHRQDPARFLAIPAGLHLDPRDSRIEIDTLQFLFVKHANFLGELLVGQDAYENAIELLNERSVFIRSVIQSRMKEAGVPQEFKMNRAELSAVIGSGNLQEAINLSDQLVDCVDEAVNDLQKLANKYGEVLRNYFPEFKIRVVLAQSENQAT